MDQRKYCAQELSSPRYQGFDRQSIPRRLNSSSCKHIHSDAMNIARKVLSRHIDTSSRSIAGMRVVAFFVVAREELRRCRLFWGTY